MLDGDDRPLRILFLGASYGSVLGMRIAAAGHAVQFACREDEVALINAHRLFLRVPARDNRATSVEIGASQCAVPPTASVPDEVDPRLFDLVCLAMQEPQYSAAGVRDLVDRIARARTPCLSLMNMPLPPFIGKFVALDDQTVNDVFTEAGLWAGFDPEAFTMASADPQATQARTDGALITSVTLPTNFKSAPFELKRYQHILERLARDIDASRIDCGGTACQPRVRLRPGVSAFVPTAKWPNGQC